MTDAPDTPDTPARRWRPPFGLLGVIALGWLTYEATHSPALASFFVSLKFAWEDLRAAFWLRRNDPAPGRGNSLFWLYTSWGVWKSAAVSLLMSLAFFFIATSNVGRVVAHKAMVAGFSTLLTTIAFSSVSAVLTIVAVAYALRSGTRLWLDSAVHRARRRKVWPPTPLCEGRRNRISYLPVAGLGLAVLFLIVFFATFGARGNGGPGWLVFALAIVVPTAIGAGRQLIAQAVEAATPQECWPERMDFPQP